MTTKGRAHLSTAWPIANADQAFGDGISADDIAMPAHSNNYAGARKPSQSRRSLPDESNDTRWRMPAM